VADFTQRIDYILTRGLSREHNAALGSITILGDQPGDRVSGPAGPLWPSDHAGLAASLLLPPAP
jgi:hypothetical protein